VAARLTGKTVAHGCATCPVEMGAAPGRHHVVIGADGFLTAFGHQSPPSEHRLGESPWRRAT
jgi:hypothetical protein